MIRTLIGFIVFCLLPPAGTLVENTNIPDAVQKEIAAYRKSRDFRAFAVCRSPSKVFPHWIKAYSFRYDTPQDAVDAAIAYCRESLRAKRKRDCPECELFLIGDIRVDGAGPEKIVRVLKAYEAEVVVDLKLRIDNHKDREALTILETFYQKVGRCEESDALLIDLAEQGEHKAQNALAYHWSERKIRLDRALALINSAIQKDPGNPSYYDTKAMVYTRLGRLDEAVKLLEKALTMKENPVILPVILDHFGDVYWLLDRKEKARGMWRRAITACSNILIMQRIERKLRNGKTEDIVFE